MAVILLYSNDIYRDFQTDDIIFIGNIIMCLT
jgi:hypothetical protein